MQISIPYLSDGSLHTERCIARRAPDARTVRLLTFPRHTRGVSIADLVRVGPERDGSPASEVIARSPLLTLHLRGPAGRSDDLAATLSPLVTAPGAATHLAAGHLAIAIPPHLLGALLERATALVPSAGRDDRRRRAGAWWWDVRSRPTAPLPLALPVRATAVDTVPEAWSPDDAISRAWDERFVAELRRRASADRDVLEALRTRRYLAAAVPVLRDVLARTYGPRRAGAATFPLGAADPEVSRRSWLAAHDGEQVRWSPDRNVDRDLRAMVVALGLDPDADPAVPTTARDVEALAS